MGTRRSESRRSPSLARGRPRASFAPVLSLLLAVAACGDPQGPTAASVAVTLVIDSAPTVTTAGYTFFSAVVVTMLDSAGRRALGASGRITLSLEAPDSAPTLLGTTSVVAALGRARFPDLRVDRAGSGYVFVAAAAGIDSGRSRPLTVIPAGRSRIRFVAQPTAVRAGDSIALEATLVDHVGNVVTDTTQDVSAWLTHLGAPDVILALGRTSRGRIRFVTSLCEAGTAHRLVVQVSDGAPDTTDAIAVEPSFPARLEFITGWQPPPDPGRPFSVSLEVRDGCGNLATGSDGLPVTVTVIEALAPYAMADSATVATTGGIALFTDLTVDRSGQYAVWAQAPGVTQVGTRWFTVVLRAARLAAGGETTCLLHPTGRILCWGSNTAGQLGDGTVGGLRGRPGFVLGTYGTVHLAVGGAHACAVDTAGTLVCWGANDFGQGGRAGGASGTPRPVAGSLTGPTNLSAGERHSCAIANGATFCWGDNTSGQLGTGGPRTASPTPALVQGAHEFRRIVAGRAHTCALDAAGTVWCWGDNSHGQLGAGAVGGTQDAPVAVAGTPAFGDVSAGANHSCAVSYMAASARVFCWGANDRGQLGTTAFVGDTAVPVQEASFGGPQLDSYSLTAGADHSCLTAGYMGTGATVCWGDNTYGQMGTGTVGGVSSIVFGPEYAFYRAASGLRHSCADGALGPRCWGDNRSGQLGAGTTGSVSGTALAVVAPQSWSAPPTAAVPIGRAQRGLPSRSGAVSPRSRGPSGNSP